MVGEDEVDNVGADGTDEVLFDGGLMVRAVGDRIISAPPLTISDEEIDTLVSRLRTALDQTAQHYGINEL